MTPEPLPDNLAEVERRLDARGGVLPSPDFRGRVLAAAEGELAAGRAGRIGGRTHFWRFAAGCAAAVVIGGNLALTAASATRFVDDPRPTAAEVAGLAESIRQVAPEVSPREAHRLALLGVAGHDLACVPLVRARSVSIGGGESP